jgi:hypothetical protein
MRINGSILTWSMLAVFIGGQISFAAEPKEIKMKAGSIQSTPAEVGNLVKGRSIEMMLHNGTRISGKVLETTSEALTMKVSTVDPEKAVAKPKAAIATRDISVIHFHKPGTAAKRSLMTAGLVFGGLMIGAAATANTDNVGSIAGALLAGGLGGGIGGAYLSTKIFPGVTIYVKPQP